MSSATTGSPSDSEALELPLNGQFLPEGNRSHQLYLRLAAVMVGAAITNQFLLEESPWLPVALLVVAAVIAWAQIQ
jgi:hypothetical protein